MDDYTKTINTIIKNLVDEGYTHIPCMEPFHHFGFWYMYFEKGNRRVFITADGIYHYGWDEEHPLYGKCSGRSIKIYAYNKHDKLNFNKNGHLLAKTIYFYNTNHIPYSTGMWFTSNIADAIEAYDKHSERRDNDYLHWRTDLDMNDVLFKAARSLNGFKNVKYGDLYVYRTVSEDSKTYHFKKHSSDTEATITFRHNRCPYIDTYR